MRFCIITAEIRRNHGQGRVNLEIAIEAARQGHEVLVLAERVDDLPAEIQKTAIVLRPPRWLPTRLLREQLFGWRTTLRLRRRRDCDAVLANGFVTWARCDVNAVHFVHASWLNSAYHPRRMQRDARSLYATLYSMLNVALERVAFGRASRLIAVSRSVAKDLERDKLPAHRVSVILNGVDTDEFHPGAEDLAKLGLPSGVKLALFAGDLKSPRKNLDTILRALPAVPDLHLAVAGREQGTPYPQMAHRLGIGARVHFLGFRQDMSALMRAVDLFVFPSRYEPCGLVLLEAMASGVPVVTARSVGIADLVDDRVGAVLEDCDDVDALAATLRSLIEDDHRRLTMGLRARALAESHSWSNMARCYVDVLSEAGAGARPMPEPPRRIRSWLNSETAIPAPARPREAA